MRTKRYWYAEIRDHGNSGKWVINPSCLNEPKMSYATCKEEVAAIIASGVHPDDVRVRMYWYPEA